MRYLLAAVSALFAFTVISAHHVSYTLPMQPAASAHQR